MEQYYAVLVAKFLLGILLVFLSPVGLLVGWPAVTVLLIAAGLYLSISAYREGSRA
ncbi:hypothetical protein [Geoglobus ahangari]|uniref:hypothetical protein n=1 Tax=Geoglobus ahangari TaxID=113653 RepID=UPI0012EB3F8A|nr:hypothetical protein [Geoglobus ahangari]